LRVPGSGEQGDPGHHREEAPQARQGH
jgi:hypothetical protein